MRPKPIEGKNLKISSVGMSLATMKSPETSRHHPDPNNHNFPLCWRGQDRPEVTSYSVAWIPEWMNCQDCKEWLHA